MRISFIFGIVDGDVSVFCSSLNRAFGVSLEEGLHVLGFFFGADGVWSVLGLFCGVSVTSSLCSSLS